LTLLYGMVIPHLMRDQKTQNMNLSIKNKTGFTLIEILIYASLLVLLIVLMANAVASLSHIIVEAKTERAIRSSAEAAIERITREIRFAQTVDTGTSSFGTHPSTLVLTSIDPFTEAPQTVTISFASNQVTIKKGTGAVETLTSDSVTVTNLVFRHIVNGATSESIRTELTIENKSFYTTTVLRRSY